MRKSEIRKLKVDAIIRHLEENWYLINIKKNGKYLEFSINYKGYDFNGSIDTKRYYIFLDDNLVAPGNDWQVDVEEADTANELEDILREEIEVVVKEIK